MKHPVLHIALRGKAHGSTVRPESGRGRGGGNAEEPDSKREIRPRGCRRRCGDNIRHEIFERVPWQRFSPTLPGKGRPSLPLSSSIGMFALFFINVITLNIEDKSIYKKRRKKIFSPRSKFKNRMKHNNLLTFKEGIMKQLERRFDEIQVQLIQYCDQIVQQAIKFRLEEPEKHDFTGNLINSFVAILYRDGHAVYYATSCGNVKLPVRVKMTKTGKWTHVAPDYEGLPHTRYNAEIPTNRGLGQEDAR
jgi:hypothetical protein